MFKIIKLWSINLKIVWDWVVEPIFRDAFEIFNAWQYYRTMPSNRIMDY